MKHELIPYKTMPTWTAETLPEPFRKMHNTKVGTWAHLTILEGALTFYELDEEGNVLAEHLFTKDSEIPFVEPQAWHRVSPASDDLKCYLTFYCTPEDYFAKKYDLTRLRRHQNSLKERCSTLEVAKEEIACTWRKKDSM